MPQVNEKLDGAASYLDKYSLSLMIIDLCKLNFGQVNYRATNFQPKFSISYVNVVSFHTRFILCFLLLLQTFQ